MFGRDNAKAPSKTPNPSVKDAAGNESAPSTDAAVFSDSNPTPFKSRSAAVIGESIRIKGTISGSENLVIEGTVEGSVELSDHDLTIGESGHVTADLKAKTVKVEGEVTGDISGAEKVIVSKAGRVRGNIIAPRVTLEDGAKFKGSIDMDPGEDQASNKPMGKPASKAPAKMDAGENKQEAS